MERIHVAASCMGEAFTIETTEDPELISVGGVLFNPNLFRLMIMAPLGPDVTFAFKREPGSDTVDLQIGYPTKK